MSRPDGRAPDQLRPVTITRSWQKYAEGSALVEFGETKVLCAASVVTGVPRWRKGSGLGWVTAEDAMLDRMYDEDVKAEPDMNGVVTGDGTFVEVQGTAEGAPFRRDGLDAMLDLALAGCAQLAKLQAEALGS